MPGHQLVPPFSLLRWTNHAISMWRHQPARGRYLRYLGILHLFHDLMGSLPESRAWYGKQCLTFGKPLLLSAVHSVLPLVHDEMVLFRITILMVERSRSDHVFCRRFFNILYAEPRKDSLAGRPCVRILSTKRKRDYITLHYLVISPRTHEARRTP